eukprot:Gb_33551 [translate_table: standard]
MANPNATTALILVEDQTDTGEKGREYRKGNWTLHETVVLIAAKKLDDERRMKGGDREKNKTAELRWKWVENYCWKNGCHRSQNQCNDKWDNLLRDYKKVRDYELRLLPGQASYWQLEKHERKEKVLPSNLLYQVYEALHEVVDKRYPPRLTSQNQTSADKPNTLPSQPQQQQHHHHQTSQSLPPQQPISGGCSIEMSDSSESDGSEIPHSPAKRRKLWKDSSIIHGLAPAMSKSASELTQTLLACEEKKDKRHRDLLGVEERKLHIEETKTEISRQGIAGLISAVNNLANAILALASDKNATATD